MSYPLPAPEAVFFAMLTLMVVWVLATLVNGIKSGMLLHAVLVIPVTWLLYAFVAPIAGLVFAVLLVAMNLVTWLLLRNWEQRRKAEDAYWRAAGTLAGSIARASRS